MGRLFQEIDCEQEHQIMGYYREAVLNRGKGKIFKGNVAHFQGKPEKPVSFLYLFILEGNIK